MEEELPEPLACLSPIIVDHRDSNRIGWRGGGEERRKMPTKERGRERAAIKEERVEKRRKVLLLKKKRADQQQSCNDSKRVSSIMFFSCKEIHPAKGRSLSSKVLRFRACYNLLSERGILCGCARRVRGP